MYFYCWVINELLIYNSLSLYDLKVKGRKCHILICIRNNKYTGYLSSRFQVARQWHQLFWSKVSRYRNRPVTETHYSPNVKLVSLSFRRMKPRDRDDIAPKYLLIADLSLPPFLFPIEKRSNVSTKGSCSVTSDLYRAINASSATIKRARAAENLPVFIQILQINN